MNLILLLVMILVPGVVSAQAVKPAERTLISCLVNASTATTLTAVGGSCVAPGTSRSIYITDIVFGASAASSTTADSAFTVKYGTGGTCGSGTTSVAAAPNAANTAVVIPLQAPIRIPRNNELCWIHSVAGTKWAVINGFLDK